MKYLTERSKEYVYDMAKGTHVLMYQRAIEGIGLALETAWNKFNDPSVPEKQKPAYLRLIKECNESIFSLTANGVSVLALKNIIERANSLGIGLDRNNPLVHSGNGNLPLSYNNDNSGIESKSSELNHKTNGYDVDK
jgi:hypothetical protein